MWWLLLFYVLVGWLLGLRARSTMRYQPHLAWAMPTCLVAWPVVLAIGWHMMRRERR